MNDKQELKNLHDAATTFIAYGQWLEKYRTWWNKMYGGKTEEEMQALDNGSSPPPPPPRVPPH